MNNKKKKVHTETRKPDTSEKSCDLDEVIRKQLKRERHLFPVRISRTTVIYTTKAKANKEYATEYNRTKLMRLKDEKEIVNKEDRL